MAEGFDRSPAPQPVRLIDFDEAQVVPGTVPETFILVVSGTKPYLTMDVSLVPLTYIRQPEFWGVEVAGTLKGVGLPATAPYTVTLPLDGVLGTEGIEVIGASRRQAVKVP
ncbi:hypothetical protein [Nonomuraea candida]|uniref:hypothetical protein n=1 Tax=Nonomuraea candida TaxID=359159 RepID=UPI0005B87965|nr:hypothetical protein [Nonomuraea candida]